VPNTVPNAPRNGVPALVDINQATVVDLDRLPGVGPSTARAIVDHRTRNGPFASVDDLLAVRGIGPAKLAELRALVRV
jgi:competence protein ComEA